MPDKPAIRIFISSPSDVRPERLKAEQIVARLDREFAHHFRVEAVLWEREPLVATRHFQEGIPDPRGTDIVVVILWSRLGVPLPAEERFRGAISGRLPVTGTEWEFEDALAGARAQKGVPHLLLYRKTAEPEGRGDRETLLQRAAQLDMVEDFFTRWFRSADGQSLTAASHSFAETGEFEEKLYDHLHALLAERAGAAAEGVIRWHEAPFRALLSYEYEHAPVFFGRTRARNELRELLARQVERGSAFVLVFGASGSGKSSLVKAGLLPDLALPGMIGRVGLVRRAVFRPSDAGGDPLAALAAAILSPTAMPELAGLSYSAEQLAALLREAPSQAALPIRQGLAEAGKAAGLTDLAEARLVVVVDQLEEIFTIDRLAQSDREAFVAALDTLAKSGLVWVVATMRSDFFDRLETLPALAALSMEGRYLLLPPDEAEIGQIIRQPALEAGLRFEHDPAGGVALDETIRQAAARDRGALPLLSFLLDQLWQKRSDAGVLTFAAYHDLGGLEGAIGNRAEQVFAAQPEAVQKELVPLLRELVTVESGKPVSRTAPLSRFPEGTPLRALADAFRDTEVRLLVNFDLAAERRTETGAAAAPPSASRSVQVPPQNGAQLRLAHEALLSHWPRAAERIAVDARDLELRGRLEAEAEAWRTARTRRIKKGRVIAGLPLAEARGLLARWGAELPAEIRAFIAASRRAARWRRMRLWGMIASAPLAVGLIAIVVWVGMVWWGVHQVEAEWAAEQEFVTIKAGCFEMGSPDSEAGRYPNEGPVHRVCLKSFDLAKYAVTQGEWRRVMIFPNNPNPSYFKSNDRLPVESVSWEDVQRFLALMNFFGSGRYHLPSEAEWEYSARAGTTTSRYWGDNIDDGCTYENIADQSFNRAEGDVFSWVARCDDGFAWTAPVGHFTPNPWGLYDMLGNTFTWTEDCMGDYSQTQTDGNPNTSEPCIQRVIRGGSFETSPQLDRSAFRLSDVARVRSRRLGFRVARTITP